MSGALVYEVVAGRRCLPRVARLSMMQRHSISRLPEVGGDKPAK